MEHYLILFLSVIGLVLCIEHDFKGFDDTILFGINWPGKLENLDNLVDGESITPQLQNNEILKVTTSTKEKYECNIPELKVKEASNIAEYDGPSPINLLKPLFLQKICSYRLESYWSYEVCHGRYIRQYHEEREGKQINTQEYFLGHWSIDKQAKLEAAMQTTDDSKQTPPTTKVDGGALPYVEMTLDDGTICDLSGRPRLTRVRYVCYPHGKHEVYSFKETSTCEYEIIILSPLLCEHPQFRPKDVGENIINCRPVDDAPKKPRNLLKMEVDSLRFHHQTIRLMNNEQDSTDSVLAVFKVEQVNKDGETHLKFELHPLTNEDEDLTAEATKPAAVEGAAGAEGAAHAQLGGPSTPAPITDDSPVRAFLNGENCLNGGMGWWKYEFCYGKHVAQYHVDRHGGRTTLLLGRYDEAAHLRWIKENQTKAPKPAEIRTSVSHFYSGGDVCDKTGKPRQTEVKLKCLENSSSPAQVSLYLLEPRTCHYILGVESPLICDILPLADENGLIKSAVPVLKRQDNVVESKEENSDYKHKQEEKSVNHGND